MGSNINISIESNNNMIKKFFLFMIFIVMGLSVNVNATAYLDNQQTIINEINNLELQNTIQPDTLIGGDVFTNNAGYTFSLTTKPLYLGISTSDVSGQVQIAPSLSIGTTDPIKTINLTQNEVYYVKFSPNSNPDYLSFTIVAVGNISNVKYTLFNVNDNGRGFSDVTNTMVGSMTKLIDINIGFWTLIYYLFIFAIIIGGIGLLVNFAFKIYDWADRTSSKKKEIFSGGHNKGGRD